jgi:hypothetical protein
MPATKLRGRSAHPGRRNWRKSWRHRRRIARNSARARAAAADEVYGEIVGQADEKGPFLAHAVQQTFIAGEFDEQFLEQIAGIGLVAGEIEQKGKQRLSMFMVKALKLR